MYCLHGFEIDVLLKHGHEIDRLVDRKIDLEVHKMV